MRARPVADRFEEKFQPDPSTGCWLWIAAVKGPPPNDYGQLSVGGCCRSAHRISWELHRGSIPNGLCVLHECDTPSCVNPDHLYLGTQSNNALDRERRGRGGHARRPDRWPRGERSGNAKLTEEMVRDLRRRRSVGETVRSIAAAMGVTAMAVSRAARGLTWAHVVAILLATVLWSSTAHGEPYTPQIIPICHVYPLADGREVCGWLTIEEVQAAYDADAELVKLRETSAAQGEQIIAFGVQISAIRAALEAERRSVIVLQASNNRLTDDVVKWNRKYEYERVKPRWGNPIAWTSAAGLAAILLGVVGKELFD